MKYTTLKSLVAITNSLIYKELTVEESTAVEFLGEKLLEALKIYEQHRHKLIASFGGKANDKGVYEGITQKTELSMKLLESENMDIPFKHTTHILSQDSIDTAKRLIPFNGLEVRIMKEWMLKKETPPVLSEKYTKNRRNNAKK